LTVFVFFQGGAAVPVTGYGDSRGEVLLSARRFGMGATVRIAVADDGTC